MIKLADIFRNIFGKKVTSSPRPTKLGHPLGSIRIGYQVGLVINDRSIELALIRCMFHRRSLVKTARIELSNQANADWSSKLIKICDLISKFLDGYKKNRIPVNIGLSGDDIALRRLNIPRMPADELTRATLWEGEKLFPFKFEDCYVGQEIVDTLVNENSIELGISITAVQKSVVDLIYRKFQHSGLIVGQIGFVPDITASLAIEKMFDLPPGNNLILYINSENSFAAFVKNRRLEFFQQFTSRPIEDEDGKISNLNAISSELFTFLDMFTGMYPATPPGAVIFAGQYAHQPEVRRQLENGMVSYAISDVHIFPEISEPFDADQLCCFLPAIQTALMASNEYPLAPPAVRKREENKSLAYRAGMAAMVGLLIVLSIHASDYVKIRSNQAELRSIQEQVAAFEKSSGYQEYLNLLAKLDRGEAFLKNKTERGHSQLHSVLKELSLTIPENLSLTSISYDSDSTGQHLQLGGSVKLRDFSPEIVLARYIERLGQSPMFRNVTVVHHRKSKTSDLFDLSFQIRMDAGV